MSDTRARPHASEDVHAIQRRTLRIVFTCQVLGGAGLAAGITVGALLARDLLGSDGLAGLPTTLFTLGSALAAFLVGRAAQRWGRRISLGAGFIAGGIGAAGVVVAATAESIGLLLVALFVYGAGTSTNLQARYAGTDLAAPERRGRAISVAMVSTTLGAVAGPNLVEPLGTLARSLDIPALAGPFLLAAVAYLAAGIALLALLRPDPLLVARSLAHEPGATPDTDATPPPSMSAYVGAGIMVLNQLVMIAIMTMTPVHMRDHHHDLGAVGLVIGAHVGAMFLPSPVTGLLVDRVGRGAVAAASGVTLMFAGVTAALVPGGSMVGMVAALILLGLGWNFGLIAGTALIVDGTVPANRARTQGTFDVLFALAGATGGGLSGIVVASGGFATLALTGGLLGLAFLPLLLWYRRATARLA